MPKLSWWRHCSVHRMSSSIHNEFPYSGVCCCNRFSTIQLYSLRCDRREGGYSIFSNFESGDCFPLIALLKKYSFNFQNAISPEIIFRLYPLVTHQNIALYLLYIKDWVSNPWDFMCHLQLEYFGGRGLSSFIRYLLTIFQSDIL